ncbi:MAG: hypothetical protein JSW55_10495, partial [Chloroflexota bacterium]
DVSLVAHSPLAGNKRLGHRRRVRRFGSGGHRIVRFLSLGLEHRPAADGDGPWLHRPDGFV